MPLLRIYKYRKLYKTPPKIPVFLKIPNFNNLADERPHALLRLYAAKPKLYCPQTNFDLSKTKQASACRQ